MSRAVLFTQCLQNDFVEPLSRYDELPNQLHVGYSEALRLMGERLPEGPVYTVMEWAYRQSAEDLAIIHIRDWHNDRDAAQHAHLNQFGPHCIRNTPGADFVFRDVISDESRHEIVNASGLNDFVDTTLAEVLAPYKGRALRVGLTGVWTEAKVTFLAYDLITRYPEFEVAVCSALTASSSRAMHFVALEQLESILGVRVFPSVGAFTEFLAGSQPEVTRRLHNARINPERLHLDVDAQVSDADRRLLLYLFRDSKEVDFRVLDGGYSGNVVLKARSRDHYGHTQVPHVIKIGPRDLIARERTAFERVQEVLGNAAPGIVDFAEIEERGAIKYRYAGMLDGDVQSFQRLYESGADLDDVFTVLDTVFIRQLGRFYEAATQERLNLLKYYDFQAKYAPGVRRRITELLERDPGNAEEIELMPGVGIPNVCLFYERDLLELHETYSAPRYMSYLHGDLNGANILIDASRNVWIIDFFHTHRGHVLKDLIKLENDLLFIFTKIDSAEELREAIRLTDILLRNEDLGEPPDATIDHQFKFPQLQRAYVTVCKLRSYYPDLIQYDRDPYQLHTGIVRYAMHTLAFDESNRWQRLWALYVGSVCAARIKDSLHFARKLRVDRLDLSQLQRRDGKELKNPGLPGLTILPGRKDRSRDLAGDLSTLKEMNYNHVLCLLTEDEFDRYGVLELKQAYAEQGFQVRYLPIPDQGTTRPDAMNAALLWMDDLVQNGKNVLIHCVGGLGRSGTVAACYLTEYFQLDADEAIEFVRQARSRRAVENNRQAEFVHDYAAEFVRNNPD